MYLLTTNTNYDYITLPIIRGKTSIDFTRIDCHEVREYYRENIFMREGNNFLGLQYITRPRGLQYANISCQL